ncbi:MAG: 3-oxoacid CoA-transferase, partial [Firmicutes bacterium]|nr:3-oxoacid CoA-transferase [Bacillota bacterium]
TKRMRVESIHPGIAREDVIENTGFELLWAPEIEDSAPPTEEELEILREDVDPRRYIIGRA